MESSLTTAPGEGSSTIRSFLRFIFLTAVVLWCAIPMSPSTVDSDFWGHVTYGQDTLTHGVAHTATYTFTARGYRWINHEHLSEIVFAVGANLLGVQSLLILKCLLGCLVLTLMIRHAIREHVHVLIIAVVCVIVSINLSFYWGLRPHMFTFTYFALLIAWTEWCFAGWSGRWNLPWPRSAASDNRSLSTRRLFGLWLCPPLLCLWTNTHGGFLAGLAVYVAILGCRAIEIGLSGQENRARVIFHLGCLITVGIIATLINPHGIQLHTWLFEALRVPRPEIQEWHPPVLFAASSIKLWVLLLLLAIGLIFSRRSRDFTQLVVLGLVLSQAMQHQRHLPFVALLFGFWIPTHLQSVREGLRPRPVTNPTMRRSPPSTAAYGSICLLLVLVCGSLAVQVGKRLQKVEVARHRFPVSALQFMADENLNGKLIVSGEWAQYALAVLGTRQPGQSGIEVAFDGRFRTCYPQEVVDRHFDFFVGNGGPDKRYRSPESPPADPKAILTSHEPDLVLLNRHQRHAVAVMQQVRQEWVLLYQDDLAQLWGRAAEFDDRQSSRYLPGSRRVIGSEKQTGSVLWPAAPRIPPTTRFVQAQEQGRDL